MHLANTIPDNVENKAMLTVYLYVCEQDKSITCG